MMTRTGAPNPGDPRYAVHGSGRYAFAARDMFRTDSSVRSRVEKASSKIWQPTPLSRPPRCRDANPVRFPLATAGGNPLLLHPCNSAPVRGKDDRIGRRRIAVIGRQKRDLSGLRIAAGDTIFQHKSQTVARRMPVECRLDTAFGMR